MNTCKIKDDLAVLRGKKRVERAFERFFETEGFALIEPSAFQSYNDFLLSNPRQDHTRTVKVLGGDSGIFVLRPDITTNLLANILARWDQIEPLDVYYNSKIYSTDINGRIFEHFQMGAESLGHEPREADLKLVKMAGEILDKLGRPYILELGSSQFLAEVLREADLHGSQLEEIKEQFKAKNRHGLKKYLNERGIENELVTSVLELEGNYKEVLTKARLLPLNRQMLNYLAELEKLYLDLGNNQLVRAIKLDLAMVPDLDYYDGIIFKGSCNHVPRKVLSGGRYDKLTARFGKQVSAIGFALDLELFTQIILEGS